jgi:hypothetical protein
MIDLVDAETVPGSMDTPIQRVKFREIATIAFLLGFESVELDIPNRELRAFSPFGTITTQPDTVLGKVLRFEGDIVAFHSLICRCNTVWVYRARDSIYGQVCFGKYQVASAYCPLRTIKRAISENIPTGMYDDEERKDIIAAGRGYSTGPIFLEATIMKRYLMKTLISLDVTSSEVRSDKVRRSSLKIWQTIMTKIISGNKGRLAPAPLSQ